MSQWRFDLFDPITLGNVIIWAVSALIKRIAANDPHVLQRWYSSSKYLKYDLAFLCDQYKDEPIIAQHIPYMEVTSWLGHSWTETTKRISSTQLITTPDIFRVSAPIQELDDFQKEALDEFKKDGKASFNGNAVRLEKVVKNKNNITLCTQKTRYFEQVQSNLVMDWEGPHTLDKKAGIRTLRAYFTAQFGRKLPPLNDSRLANSIGVSVIIFFRSQSGLKNGATQYIPYLPRRVKFTPLSGQNRVVAVFDTGTFHCTASGVAETLGDTPSLGSDEENQPLAATLTRDIYRELEEEVGLRPEDIEIIIPLAICREFLRGGKPQIFFGGVTHLSERQLMQRRIEAIDKIRLRQQTHDTTAKLEIEDKHYLYSTPEELEDLILRQGLSIEAVTNLHYADRFIQQFVTGRKTSIE